MTNVLNSNGFSVTFLTSASVEEVCFYQFSDMVNMKHALQGATMYSITSSPFGLENCPFQIIEVAPQWIKLMQLSNNI